MLTIIVALTALAVVLVVVAVAELIPARDRAVTRRLAELQEIASQRTLDQRRRRTEKRQQLEVWMQAFGEKVSQGRKDIVEVRRKLLRAGFRRPDAVPIFYSIRVFSLAIGVIVFVFAAPVLGLTGSNLLLWLVASGIVAWMLPAAGLSRRIRHRQKEIQKALPDALDMLVICVEAGLGLNQALLRVSEEVENISEVMSEELQIVNLEIRAGTPREDALRNLGERTGVADLQALATMLIQTDRFGTSIAQALRVHSDSLRTKRRQRAEEAAAKTTIKLVPPLVFFIFPAIFVVVLGPAMLHLIRELGAFQ